MRRLVASFAAAMAVLALTATIVMAAITWHSGPTLTWNADGSASATGNLSGLGNQHATASLTVTSHATYTCQNNGGQTAPGQNSVEVFGSTGSQSLTPDKNGRATLNVSAGAPDPADTVGGKEAGCPNGKWTGVNPQLTGPTTARLEITQGGQPIFCQVYTEGSSDGTAC
jgi:hypothetical protein